MNELIFRGKDLFRPSWSNLGPLLVVIVLQLVFGGMKLGTWGALWLVLGTLVLAVPAFVLSWRCWSRVGGDGVTVCWGVGRGRTYPWHEVRWIDVRETKSNGSTSYAARIHLTDGRRRSLPGLQTSAIYPAADFEVNFRRLVNWWEYSTDATQRVKPAKQFRDRLTPTVIGVLVGIVVVVVVFVVVALQGQ
ncbi:MULTISPECIES: PH domain-containing protein [unclassified Kitasatospora]|uniref:PH domain-containing protein n=1 Tax=unclassified Kitasatospora TaxID=2633591 RepID=UPI0033C90039